MPRDWEIEACTLLDPLVVLVCRGVFLPIADTVMLAGIVEGANDVAVPELGKSVEVRGKTAEAWSWEEPAWASSDFSAEAGCSWIAARKELGITVGFPTESALLSFLASETPLPLDTDSMPLFTDSASVGGLILCCTADVTEAGCCSKLALAASFLCPEEATTCSVDTPLTCFGAGDWSITVALGSLSVLPTAAVEGRLAIVAEVDKEEDGIGARRGGVSLLILTPRDLHRSPKLGIAILTCTILSFCFAVEPFWRLCPINPCAEVPTEWGMWVALGMGMGLEVIVDWGWDRVDDVSAVATACCSRLTIELIRLVKSATVSLMGGEAVTLDVAPTLALPDVKCCDFWAKDTLAPFSADTTEELIPWRSRLEIASKLLEGEETILFRVLKGFIVPVTVWAPLTTVEGGCRNVEGSSIALVSRSPPAIGVEGSSRSPRVEAMSTWVGFWSSSDIVSDMEEDEAPCGALGSPCSAIVSEWPCRKQS